VKASEIAYDEKHALTTAYGNFTQRPEVSGNRRIQLPKLNVVGSIPIARSNPFS
jgi:hypothetical protein